MKIIIFIQFGLTQYGEMPNKILNFLIYLLYFILINNTSLIYCMLLYYFVNLYIFNAFFVVLSILS